MGALCVQRLFVLYHCSAVKKPVLQATLSLFRKRFTVNLALRTVATSRDLRALAQVSAV